MLSGVVTRFKGDGRKLGYPTANIAVQTDLSEGVYFGYADLSTKFVACPAFIFVGVPTTLQDERPRVEAHLFDIPDQDYYELPLTLSVQYFFRPNKTFDSLEALQQTLHADETAARRWFEQHPFATAPSREYN